MTITTTHHSWCSEHLSGEDVDQCVSNDIGSEGGPGAWLVAESGGSVRVAIDTPTSGELSVDDAREFVAALTALIERVAS